MKTVGRGLKTGLVSRMNWASILNIHCGRLSESNHFLVFGTQVGYTITEFSPIYTPSRGRACPLTLGVKTEIHSLLTPTRRLTRGGGVRDMGASSGLSSVVGLLKFQVRYNVGADWFNDAIVFVVSIATSHCDLQRHQLHQGCQYFLFLGQVGLFWSDIREHGVAENYLCPKTSDHQPSILTGWTYSHNKTIDGTYVKIMFWNDLS